ncbi:AI-2E family transporter [bacterium]|nr:AI-2E family transporter [bacterium]
MNSTDKQPSPIWADRHIWQLRPVRDLIWMTLFVAVIWFGYYLQSVFMPVLLALGMAYLFNPIIDYAETRFKFSRPFIISILFTVLILVLIISIAILVPILFQQAKDLVFNIKGYINSLKNEQGDSIIKDVLQWISSMIEEYQLEDKLREHLQGLPERAQENAGSILGAVSATLSTVFKGTAGALKGTLGFVGDVLGTTTYLLLAAILIPIYFFYFAWHFYPMMRGVEIYIPASQRKRVVSTVKKMDKSVSSFIRGRLIIAVILGAMLSVGWWIAGVPYWLLLGMLAGFLNIVPFASGLIWPLAMLFKYLEIIGDPNIEFSWLSVVVWPTVVFQGGQFLEAWILTPYIQSQDSNLNAIEVIIVMMVGAAVAGFYGLLLAIPIASCIKILMKDVVFDELEVWAKKN